MIATEPAMRPASPLATLLSLSLLASLVLPLGAPTPAQAQAPSNKAAADVLFDHGKKLMDEGKFAEACPKFAESQRLDPAPGTLIWLADCYEKNGQTASAWSTYREALAAAKAAGQAQREALAKERIGALEKQLSTLSIRVVEPGMAGLEVKLDGQALGKPLWGTPIPYDPGPHVVEASAPGHTTFQTKVDLGKGGASLVVEVPGLAASTTAPAASASGAAAPVPPAAASGSPAPPAAETPAASAGPWRTVGFVAGGTGLAVGLAGSILAVTARSAAQKAIDDCRARGFCSQDELDRHDSARGRNTLGLVLGGVGAAMLVGGAVLVLTSPTASKTSSAWLTPQVGRSYSGLSLGGSF